MSSLSEKLESAAEKSLVEADNYVRALKTYPRPSKDKKETILCHEAAQNYQRASSKNETVISVTNLTSIRHSSLVADLNKLEPIQLKDMYVSKVHKGKYLLCRTLTDPFYLKSMHTVICDENDQVENLCMYYCFPESVEAALVLPKGSILIIKEPHLMSCVGEDEAFYIRVESPSDLVIVSDLVCDEELQKYWPGKWMIDESLTYEQLNAKGNKHFVDKNYYDAVRLYTRALNLAYWTKTGTSKDIKKTLNNRSLANFRLERFYMAYQDALKSSQIEIEESEEARSINEKTYFRMGKALYSMREYSQSVIWFTKCVEINPSNTEACAELARAKERVHESETGEYNMKRIIEDCNAKIRRLDVADYVCPDIEVVSLNGNPNFKGVVAKADIKRNTLLVGSKALSIIYRDCIKSKVITMDQHTRLMYLPKHSQILRDLINKVQNDPFTAKNVYKLYAGADVDRNKPISEFVVDTRRLETTLWRNAFETQAFTFLEDDEDDLNNGLFFFPSFFNHSCCPNITKFTCSDFMMIYTTRDIKKGEELTITYLGLVPYERRLSYFEKQDFKCNCRICKLDGQDVKLSERTAYVRQQKKKLEDYFAQMKACQKVPEFKYVDDFVVKVKAMYGDKPDGRIKIDVITALNLQAQFYRLVMNTVKLAEIYIECFEILKDINVYNGMHFLFMIIASCFCNSNNLRARKWLKVAKDYLPAHRDLFEYLCRKKLAGIEDLDQWLKEI